MHKEILNKILEVREAALQDEIYLQLYSYYEPTQKELQKMMSVLPPEQLKILQDYLSASVELHHRLMTLAILHK